GLRAEAIVRHPGFVGDPQREAAVGMRGPDGPVLAAEGAAAGAHRNRRPGLRPVEGDADVSAMAAAVYASEGDCVAHVGRPRLISAPVRNSTGRSGGVGRFLAVRWGGRMAGDGGSSGEEQRTESPAPSPLSAGLPSTAT